MNEELQNYARKRLIFGLKKLNEEQQHLFKRMYSPYKLDKPIEIVVKDMDPNRLDWAMQQVARTIVKKK